MRAVHSPSGPEGAPPQPFARRTGTSAPETSRLRPARIVLRQRLATLRLRARLILQGSLSVENVSKAATAAFDRTGRAMEAAGRHAANALFRAAAWRRVALVASAPFVLPYEFRAAMVRILAYLGAIASLSVIAAELVKEAPPPATAEAVSRPAWMTIDRPWPAFQLSLPGFSDEDMGYAIRRHAQGGGRKDILSFGSLGETPHMMSVEIYRAGSEIDGFGNPEDNVHEMAGAFGTVDDLRSAPPVASKFGKLQSFAFVVSPFVNYNCLGFVRTLETHHVQLRGLSCSLRVMVDRPALSCALDRLTLLSAGSDPDIARLFARAELKRSFCGQRDHLLYATPRLRGMTEQSAQARPALRGRVQQ